MELLRVGVELAGPLHQAHAVIGDLLRTATWGSGLTRVSSGACASGWRDVLVRGVVVELQILEAKVGWAPQVVYFFHAAETYQEAASAVVEPFTAGVAKATTREPSAWCAETMMGYLPCAIARVHLCAPGEHPC